MDKKTFDCTYTINSSKKHKVFSDGYLYCVGKNVSLHSYTDTLLDKAINASSPNFSEDDELHIGKYIVHVGLCKDPSSTSTSTSNPYTTNRNVAISNNTTPISNNKPLLSKSTNLLQSAPIQSTIYNNQYKPPIQSSHSSDLKLQQQQYQQQYQPQQQQQQQQSHYQQQQSHHQPQQLQVPQSNAPTKPNFSQFIPTQQNQSQPQLQSQQQQQQQPQPQPGSFPLRQSPLIFVSAHTNKILRPHQRDGIKFIFDCLIGQTNPHYHGCILMDDVGLGKTLQTIGLIDALISYPFVKSKKVIICCPTILVNMWYRELVRFLPPFAFIYTVVTPEKNHSSKIESFVASNRLHICIISYEQCRKYGDILSRCANSLLVCDEAHRLKSVSDDNKTISILKSIPTRLKLLLTATPVQNDLTEFFALANFANPGFLSHDLSSFTSTYTKPILAMRDPRNINNSRIQQTGQETNNNLMDKVNQFCLRRTHDTIGQFLPPKTEYLLFLKPSSIQIAIMTKVIEIYKSNTKQYQVLPVLNLLRKISTSPYLLSWNDNTSTKSLQLSQNNNNNNNNIDDDVDSVANIDGLTTSQSIISQIKHLLPTCSPLQSLQSSSKLTLLYKLIQIYIPYTNIIIISNFTETLRYIQSLFTSISSSSLQFLNLDGSCDTKSRNSTIERFNTKVSHNQAISPSSNFHPTSVSKNSNVDSKSKTNNKNQAASPTKHSILLLSAKAAGAGLNLINGCVQIKLDSNWNPAVDTQACGRMWRYGNTQHVMSFDLITNGSIDEHIFLRKIAKNDIASSLLSNNGDSSNSKDSSYNNSNSSFNNQSNNSLNKFTPEELRNVLLFQHQAQTTYNMLKSTEESTKREKVRPLSQLPDETDMYDQIKIQSPNQKKQKLTFYQDSDDSDDNNDDNTILQTSLEQSNLQAQSSSSSTQQEPNDENDICSATNIETINGQFSYYSSTHLPQLVDLTLPIILTATSFEQRPTEDSTERITFLNQSSNTIFTSALITYSLIKQTDFNTPQPNETDEDVCSSNDSCPPLQPQITSTTEHLPSKSIVIHSQDSSIPQNRGSHLIKSHVPIVSSLLNEFQKLPKNMFESSSDDE